MELNQEFHHRHTQMIGTYLKKKPSFPVKWLRNKLNYNKCDTLSWKTPEVCLWKSVPIVLLQLTHRVQEKKSKRERDKNFRKEKRQNNEENYEIGWEERGRLSVEDSQDGLGSVAVCRLLWSGRKVFQNHRGISSPDVDQGRPWRSWGV